MDEDELIKKVLRSLPKSYSSKVYTIEERKDFDKYTMDRLYFTFTIIEMREFELDIHIKEAIFRASKKTKEGDVD